ncbi:CRE-CLEC-149 protein [Caenorhabditis remanei]|uniref:CRE-CLEC-149 protein n=1 Tax=Caenorhabditis remanei TaxID=31234 RepID=E3ML78_CAERE|nr:CRE-CLEC-149 protein [Caenorhabditis remanei]
MLTVLSVLLSLLCVPVTSFLPTFPPNNKNPCEKFGFNWAAEIRCLRDIINKCEDGEEKSRGGRSLQDPYSNNYPTEASTTDYGNPYSYPRPYSRTYYRHSISPIRPPIPQPITTAKPAGECSCQQELEKLEAKFEKKLYEVKMKAAYETETAVGELRKQFEQDLRSYERITTKDVVEIKRTLDYMQAPRVMNNDVEYFLIQREESWYTASEKCIGYGAHLASVHSRLDNGLLAKLIPANETVWIGVNDIQKENVFRNTDGTPVDFLRWAQKQPNNEEHNENCVEVDHNGYWNDKLCIIMRPFVCKKLIS